MRKTFLTLALLAASCRSTMIDPTKIDALLADYSGERPGAAVGIVKDGKVVFAKGYGLADLETRSPMTPSSNVRMASITKQFAATAIELLAERGKLSYDDPITRWLPTLPEYAKAITVRHLLLHTSGLADYEDLIPESQTEQVLDPDILSLLEKTTAPVFPAGSKYAYSNTGYVFLGLIAERAAGENLGTFMKREIFDRAGMRNTLVMEPGVLIPNRSFGHARKDGVWFRRDQSVTSATRGDGAVYSSVEDMIRWNDALDRSSIVQPATLAEAFRPHVATNDAGISYGYGWRIGAHDGRKMIWHTGETTSFRNAFVRFPEEKLSVIVLTNRNEGRPLDIARAIADLFRAN